MRAVGGTGPASATIEPHRMTRSGSVNNSTLSKAANSLRSREISDAEVLSKWPRRESRERASTSRPDAPTGVELPKRLDGRLVSDAGTVGAESRRPKMATVRMLSWWVPETLKRGAEPLHLPNSGRQVQLASSSCSGWALVRCWIWNR